MGVGKSRGAVRRSCLLAALLLLQANSSLSFEGPSTAALPPTESIVNRLLAADARRAASLRSYTGERHYHLSYRGFLGSRDAEMQVETVYQAPDKKTFKIISQSGSQFLITHALQKLLDSEKEYLKEPSRSESALSPKNYVFELTGVERGSDGGDLYVLSVTPRSKNKYLYRGKIWVDSRDFAIAKIEGEPAKSPSFWIGHSKIDHVYKKVGDFWLPSHDESVTEVRLGGKAVLTIDYQDYQVSANNSPATDHPAPGSAVLPPPEAISADPH